MTKEEAIEHIRLMRLNAAISDAKSFREALDIAIDALSQPSLPSNLDEAADNHAANNGGRWLTDDIGIKCFAFNPQEVKDAFKAGAEWMAGQGVKLHGRILPGTRCNLYIESDCFDRGFGGLNYKFSDSNDVDMFVQIRKK